MKITMRGWARDMGEKEIIDLDLKSISKTYDPRGHRTIYKNKPGIFTSVGRIFISWFQKLQHSGNYRMEIEFSNEDVLHLFKSKFGTELRPWLLDDENFTLSPELTKLALRTIKLSDVTLGDLAAMQGASGDEAPKADKLVESGNLRILRRKVD
jgi:hypothetical protein